MFSCALIPGQENLRVVPAVHKAKPVDNFDLSLNLTEQDPPTNNGYMSVDQFSSSERFMTYYKGSHSTNAGIQWKKTFHTPSFGDEEFEIPPLSLAQSVGNVCSGNGNDVYGNQPLNHQQHQSQLEHPSCNQSLGIGMTTASSPPVGIMENTPQHYPGPPPQTGPPQEMYMNQMGDSSGDMMTPHSMHMPMQSYDVRTTYVNAPMQQQLQPHMDQQQQQQQQHQQQQQQQLQHHQMPMMQQQQPHLHNMGPPHAPPSHPQQQPPHSSPVGGHSPMFTTISQSQLSSQLGLQIGMPPTSHQGPGSVGSSPPGSNQTSPGLETSEDSDDSAPISQLMGGVKRPSPEPVDTTSAAMKNGNNKKPKVQKKKKKRDPNEPQKPVSAYALFFRDTQAAIKGQNPNASFGEVSKIVASMWDSLDAEHKNVYKKKTEAAKKEYLKALAAYRASLVSKAAADQSDTLYGSSNVSSTTPPTVSSPSNSPPGQILSPLQKKSPLLTSLMEGMPQVTNMAPPQQSGCQVWGMHPQIIQNQMVHIHHQLQPQVPPMMQQAPPQQMVPQMGNRPQMGQAPPPQQQPQQVQPLSQQVSNSPSYTQNMSPMANSQGLAISDGMMQQPPTQTCLRNGCSNPAIDSPDWDREYCSSECVVSHCRDVFTAWVASRQASNSYASVK